MGQGQGENTPIKQERLSKLLRQRMVMSKNMPGDFHVIDLNAGCGHNHEVGVPGSPLIALAAAQDTGRSCRFYFVEKDGQSVGELCQRIASWPQEIKDRIEVYGQDNATALPTILSRIEDRGDPRQAIGLLYCDPNGYTSGLPREAIAAFAARARRIDLYFSLNATAAVRIKRCAEKHPEMNMPDMDRVFGDILALKRFCMVAPPPPVCGHQFLQVMLTNVDIGLGGWRDFLRGDSPAAARVLADRRPVSPQKELF